MKNKIKINVIRIKKKVKSTEERELRKTNRKKKTEKTMNVSKAKK